MSATEMRITPPAEKLIYIDVNTGNDANRGSSLYAPVRTLERAHELAADRRGYISVNWNILECCDAPDFKVYALVVSKRPPRARWEKHFMAALSWCRFIAVCQHCGAEWMPIEAAYPSGNRLLMDDVVIEGCI